MSNKTLFLCIVVIAAFVYFAKRPAATTGESAATTPTPHPAPSLKQPLVTMVGQVEQKLTDAIVVSCPRPHRPVVDSLQRIGGGGGVYYGIGHESEIFGRFVLRNHPDQSRMADGDDVDIRVVEDGLYERHGESLHAYWFVDKGAPKPPPAKPTPTPVTRWKSSLDAPEKHGY